MFSFSLEKEMDMKQSNRTENKKSNQMPPNRLWFHRKKMGYSQQVVATLLGCKSPARICDYELGKRIPSLETALKLEITLCVPIAFLYPELFKQLKQRIKLLKEQL